MRQTTKTTEVPATNPSKIFKLTPATDGFVLIPGAPRVWVNKAGERKTSYVYKQEGNFKYNTGVVAVTDRFQLFFRNSNKDLIQINVHHLSESKIEGSDLWSPIKSFIQDLLSQHQLVYQGTDDIAELIVALKSIKELKKSFMFTQQVVNDRIYYQPVRCIAPIPNNDLNYTC